MARSKRSAEWRKFEELVALIECHLCQRGAVVRSPDHIPDRVTGALREVDASIRYQVGSVPILITIECRRRSVKQDVTWIEQIARKRDDIGASTTVAVSASDFSQPALKKARFHGVETRLLRDIDGEAIRDWAQQLEFILVRGSFGMGRLYVRFREASGTESTVRLHPDVINGYEKGDVEYKFIRRLEDDTPISLADLLRQSDQEAGNPGYERPNVNVTVNLPANSSAVIPYSERFPGLFQGVPIGGEPVTKVFGWDFDPNEATVETEQGPALLEHLAVEFHVIQRAYPVNMGRLLAYESELGLIRYVHEQQVPVRDGETMRVVVSGNPDM